MHSRHVDATKSCEAEQESFSKPAFQLCWTEVSFELKVLSYEIVPTLRVGGRRHATGPVGRLWRKNERGGCVRGQRSEVRGRGSGVRGQGSGVRGQGSGVSGLDGRHAAAHGDLSPGSSLRVTAR